jgi:hypothetical protein
MQMLNKRANERSSEDLEYTQDARVDSSQCRSMGCSGLCQLR